MGTGRRELERAARPLLAAHVCKIGRRRLHRAVRGRRGLRRELDLPAEKGHRLGEVADGDGLDAGESRLLRRLRRTEEPVDS